MPFTFKDIQEKSLARVDIDINDVEEQGLQAVKDAINTGYSMLAATVDKRTSTFTLALDDYNNKLPKPSNFASAIIAEHETLGEINKYDYEDIGDFINFKSHDITSGDVTVTYNKFPDKLVNDTDEIVLKDAYIGALTAYAAYVYQLYKKKYAAAQLLLQEFNSFMPSQNQQAAQQVQSSE